MASLHRDPESLANSTYDLLIIGGGIYGVTLALEASLQGYKSLLLEKGDFGAATSWNSLRIIHGGLRYLQTLDIQRFRESVTERKWFLTHFPDLVKPLACLIPLYNEGLHRTSIFRLALTLNSCLSITRNRGVKGECRIEKGEVLSISETLSKFPQVDKKGLCGAAVWYDGVMVNPPRMVVEILRWACKYGACVLNYMEGKELIVEKGRVKGISGKDQVSGEEFQYRSPVVVNCAGPWARKLACKMDRDIPKLFKSSLAFNIIFNRNPISEYAVAVAPRNPKGKAYFIRPFNDRIFAGTYHAPWSGEIDYPKPRKKDLLTFISDLNRAIPGLELNLNDIFRIFSGLLPAKKMSSDIPASKEVIIDHEEAGGPVGLYSVSGVKYTTARLVAEKTLRRIYPQTKRKTTYNDKTVRPTPDNHPHLKEFDDTITNLNKTLTKKLKHMFEEESILHLDDLMLRRTDWTNAPFYSPKIAKNICRLLEWNSITTNEELKRLNRSFFNITDQG